MGQRDHSVEDTLFSYRSVPYHGTDQPYALFKPPCPKDTPLPLILFLHGKGERGSDGIVQTRVGLGRIISRHPTWFPCLVALPQCPSTRRWTESLELVDQTWSSVEAEHAVDPERVVITGISMGGFGAWAYAAQRHDRVAALVPICGGGWVERASRLARLPIWAFHGAQDDVIDVDQSRRMIDAVRLAGGHPHYTEYADEGHNCWDRAYGEEQTIRWMLAQRRCL